MKLSLFKNKEDSVSEDNGSIIQSSEVGADDTPEIHGIDITESVDTNQSAAPSSEPPIVDDAEELSGSAGKEKGHTDAIYYIDRTPEYENRSRISGLISAVLVLIGLITSAIVQFSHEISLNIITCIGYLLIAVVVWFASKPRDGKLGSALAATAAMLIVFAIDSEYSALDYLGKFITSDDLIILAHLYCCVTLFAVIFACYAILREKRNVYLVSWVILMVVAAVHLISFIGLLNDNADVDPRSDAVMIPLVCLLNVVLYALIMITLARSNPFRLFKLPEDSQGYRVLTMSSDHDAKSSLIKNSALYAALGALFFIGTFVLLFQSNSTVTSDWLLYNVCPPAIALVIFAVVFLSRPDVGPANHALKYSPLLMIGLSIYSVWAVVHEVFQIHEINGMYQLMPGMASNNILSTAIVKYNLPAEIVYVLSFVMLALPITMMVYRKYNRILYLVAPSLILLSVSAPVLLPYVADAALSTHDDEFFALLLLLLGSSSTLISNILLSAAFVIKCDVTVLDYETDAVAIVTESRAESVNEYDRESPRPAPVSASRETSKPKEIFCTNCGGKIPVGDSIPHFCPGCGAAVQYAEAASEEKTDLQPEEFSGDVILEISRKVTEPVKVVLDDSQVFMLSGGQTIELPIRTGTGSHKLLFKGKYATKFYIDFNRPTKIIVSQSGSIGAGYYTMKYQKI